MKQKCSTVALWLSLPCHQAIPV
uniref:Uncharacterized protein n=1 Tax=Rhizophora mucronata TaxID=61149 RepID=A0A2P2NF21_RHIMU